MAAYETAGYGAPHCTRCGVSVLPDQQALHTADHDQRDQQLADLDARITALESTP